MESKRHVKHTCFYPRGETDAGVNRSLTSHVVLVDLTNDLVPSDLGPGCHTLGPPDSTSGESPSFNLIAQIVQGIRVRYTTTTKSWCEFRCRDLVPKS